MRIHSGATVVFSVAFAILALSLAAARAEDQPKDQPKARTTAPADTPARPENGGLQFPLLQRIRSAVDELKLSDEQKGKIDKLFETAKSDLKEARDSANGDRQAVAKKARETFNTLRESLMTILDDDQKAELRTKLQSLFSGRAGTAGGDMIARLRAALEKLNLGGDQKRQIHDLLESAETKAKDLREKAQAGEQDAREKLAALMRDTRQKIGEILTDSQKEKLQEALQQPGARQPARPNPNQ